VNRLEIFRLYREMEYVITEALTGYENVNRIHTHTHIHNGFEWRFAYGEFQPVSRRTRRARKISKIPKLHVAEFTSLGNCRLPIREGSSANVSSHRKPDHDRGPSRIVERKLRWMKHSASAGVFAASSRIVVRWG
jgi:hypothetical protein